MHYNEVQQTMMETGDDASRTHMVEMPERMTP
jgi:hypothetical protein